MVNVSLDTANRALPLPVSLTFKAWIPITAFFSHTAG